VAGCLAVSTKNLVPGQYQIGEVVFGRHTIYPVSHVEIQSYNVNAQDFQVIRSSETRFGHDNFVAAPIMFEIGVIDNYALPNMAGLTGRDLPNIEAGKWALHRLAKEWRGDDVREAWGEMKPLRCCERDGRVLLWFGRPRKFQYSKRSRKSEFFTIQAEYQRADTLQYSDEEFFETFDPAEIKMVSRTDGDMSAWLRILLVGPANDPVITLGSQVIQLDHDIAAGRVVEISSYPWQRRVIDDTGLNLAAKLIGATQYLDKIKFPENTSMNVQWTATGTDGNSQMLFLWREAYSVMA
jgi:hypothetical protein